MTDTPPVSPPAPSPVDRFFNWIRSTGITRDEDRWIAGVCGGIAARIGLDPMIVRGVVVVIAILGGPAVLAYAVGWALLPTALGRIYVEDAIRGRFQPVMIAIGLLLFFSLAPVSRGFWWEGPPTIWGMPDWLSGLLGVGWSLLVIAGIIWLVVYLVRRGRGAGGSTSTPDYGPGSNPGNSTGTDAGYGSGDGAKFWSGSGATGSFGPEYTGRAGDTASFAGTGTETRDADARTRGTGTVPPPTAAERSRAWQAENRARQAARRAAWRARRPGAGYTSIVLGLALAVGAAASIVRGEGSLTTPAIVLGLACVLGVLAIGIVIAGIRGRTDGAMGFFAVLVIVKLVALAIFAQGAQFSAFGTNIWQVSSSNAGSSTPSYVMIAGTATLDLSVLDDPGPADNRTIDLWIGAGVTELILPEDAPVRVETNALAGGVDYSSGDTSSENGARDGVFIRDTHAFNQNSDERGPLVRIWTLAGVVTDTPTS